MLLFQNQSAVLVQLHQKVDELLWMQVQIVYPYLY